MFSACAIQHTTEFECNIIAGYLLSTTVVLFFKDCKFVQNLSMSIFSSVFITESPTASHQTLCMMCTKSVIGKMMEGQKVRSLITQNGKMFM